MAQIGAQFVQAVSGLPVGTVIYDYPSNNIPSGWIATDGQAVSRTDYAALFNVLGTTYGSGNGSTTFNLPKQSQVTDVGGRVTLPYQPFFSGHRDAGTVTSGTWVVNQAAINRGSHYNTSTGVFTCPVAGAYLMSCQGIGWRSPGYGYIYLYKNGIQQGPFGHWNLSADSWANPNVTAIISAAANDTLNFAIGNTGGNGGLYGINHNSAMIALVG